MYCDLVIPNLFSAEQGADSFRHLKLPVLKRLVNRASSDVGFVGSTETLICRLFGIAKQQDWPIAPLTLRAEPFDADNCYWLRADPIHLYAAQNHLLLADTDNIGISHSEAHALCTALNSHFQADGIEFIAPHAKRWYARCSKTPELQTYELSLVRGQDINAFLPSGADALYWHRLLNEIQMLLHTHEVNQLRESRGLPIINSVWFWGGGILPTVTESRYQSVWSDNFLTKSLAILSRAKLNEVPAHAEAALNSEKANARHLIELDKLALALQQGDLTLWQRSLQEYETQWFAPLLNALKKDKCRELNIYTAGKKFTVTKSDLWKVWRKNFF